MCTEVGGSIHAFAHGRTSDIVVYFLAKVYLPGIYMIFRLNGIYGYKFRSEKVCSVELCICCLHVIGQNDRGACGGCGGRIRTRDVKTKL